MSARGLFLGAVIALGCAGCGVSSWVTADQSRYPISMSNGLRGPDGRVIPPEHIHPVGHFEQRYLACSMLWRIISFTGHHDVSDDVNEQVKALGADAITNLAVTSGVTGWQLFTFLGIFPDCSKVSISGDIVKVDRPAPPPPPEPPPVTPPPADTTAAPPPATTSPTPPPNAAPTGAPPAPPPP